MAGDLHIPPRLARTVVAWEGDRGQGWLRRLPALVAELASGWDLDVGPPFEPGGQISWVAPVRRRRDGGEAVLKVQLPHPESGTEALGLATWGGVGAVELLAHDAQRCGLLLERCHPGLALADHSDHDAVLVQAVAVAASLHEPAPPAGVASLAEVLDRWGDELEGRLARHGSADPGMDAMAVATFREVPRTASRQVLLHGDLNPTNVLSARRSPWLAIDPKPMVGDPAYDGARLVTQPDPHRSADPAATVARRLAVVATALDVPEPELARWCVADCVEIAVSARATGDHRRAAASHAAGRLLLGHL